MESIAQVRTKFSLHCAVHCVVEHICAFYICILLSASPLPGSGVRCFLRFDKHCEWSSAYTIYRVAEVAGPTTAFYGGQHPEEEPSGHRQFRSGRNLSWRCLVLMSVR